MNNMSYFIVNLLPVNPNNSVSHYSRSWTLESQKRRLKGFLPEIRIGRGENQCSTNGVEILTQNV